MDIETGDMEDEGGDGKVGVGGACAFPGVGGCSRVGIICSSVSGCSELDRNLRVVLFGAGWWGANNVVMGVPDDRVPIVTELALVVIASEVFLEELGFSSWVMVKEA